MMKTLVLFFMTLSVCVLAMPSTKSYNNDHYSNRNKVTNMNNETSPPEEGTSLLQEIDTDIKLKLEGNDICAYDRGSKVLCVNVKKACGTKFLAAYTIGCADDEERFAGNCFKKCSLLANKDFPLRTTSWTCARNGCTSSQEYDAGLCYPKCKEYYIGVATLCWGYCSKFCGKDYSDMGLYCYRWWPPHSCYKPRYDRGVGSLPYQPWTNGLGCSGFGVNNEGGCPLEDISYIAPIDLGCNK
ncbi:PREDICTED: uncharacterized protein LOC109582417 isoform X2 [Amphimedon queenslandica]|uniref:Uncharacterized protein n=1 Tax=Amphimedon queenslandica TaxID=400682 RepID=A0A1X7URV4_AMPQE|nr:PREDICTED: uncharacterized protein LOC109582417 isoform X2 [Amphimedon queenslandica]|eukprot:XP_019852662.1 PREDICTED: uncharacterized protein LOC109582417 isoform X2 [Amphimedon queenslandica]